MIGRRRRPAPPTAVQEYASGFAEEPGYFDHARLGPPSRAVLAEARAHGEALARARYGSLAGLGDGEARMRTVLAETLGPDFDTLFQPGAEPALLHLFLGLTGEVLYSPAEPARLTGAAARAAETLRVLSPRPLVPDHRGVTPGDVRRELRPATVAVAVSLVDETTGVLADIEGIRQVIGDRLLLVDATQGLGVVDAPYGVADVVVAGGHAALRAGPGTGLLAMGSRALDRILPVLGGGAAPEADDPGGALAAHGVERFRVGEPDPVAAARLAAALEGAARVGAAAVGAAVAERARAVIDLADAHAVTVASPRPAGERAGIVVLEPAPQDAARLQAALVNHGVQATVTRTGVRLSVHVTTGEESLDLLRGALVEATRG